MRKIDNPFLAGYPCIDLHGLTGVEARIKTNEFITDNLKLKNYNIIIIHGKGTGTVKSNVHKYLSNDKRVMEFKTDNFNDGITVVKLEGESMKNRKGFTLIELLAVIALLGVILLLVVPNVLGLFNKAKKNLFVDEVLSVYNTSYSTYIYRSSQGDYTKRFCVGKDNTTNAIELEEKENFYYDITVNAYGEIISLKVSDGTFGINLSSPSGVKKKNIKSDAVEDAFDINCNGSSSVVPGNESLTCIITNSIRYCNIFSFNYNVENGTL